MVTEEEYLEAVEVLKKYKSQLKDKIIVINNLLEGMKITPDSKVKDMDISIRLLYIIKGMHLRDDFDDVKLKDLGGYSTRTLLHHFFIGKNSLRELTDLLAKADLKLQP
jgi:hypothetical protein